MSIPWNRDVLLGRRFVSGAFAHYRWNFRLSTGESPLTQWYGDVTWVFDPGISEGIILLDATGIRYQIGYVSRIEFRLSFILGILVTCAKYGTEYSCVECDNGFLVPLKSSDDGDGFPLPWLEFFVSWTDCIGCGLYSSKIKVMTFFYDDDGDYFPWSKAFLLRERVHRYIQLTCLWYNPNQATSVMRRKMVKSDCDGDVFSFPWSENHISMKRKIMVTNRQRCRSGGAPTCDAAVKLQRWLGFSAFVYSVEDYGDLLEIPSAHLPWLWIGRGGSRLSEVRVSCPFGRRLLAIGKQLRVRFVLDELLGLGLSVHGCQLVGRWVFPGGVLQSGGSLESTRRRTRILRFHECALEIRLRSSTPRIRQNWMSELLRRCISASKISAARLGRTRLASVCNRWIFVNSGPSPIWEKGLIK
ncbi:unnamed protein product [Arabidopsis halleri]